MTGPMDDATLALATITVGLDRIRDLALGDTSDTEDVAGALRTLYRDGEPRDSVLGILADLLDDIAARVDDDGLDVAAEELGEAAALLRGDAGSRLRAARETITGPDATE
ncbi:hypothetical protein ACWDBD_37130 [Streptomyces sp. NPDC001118]